MGVSFREENNDSGRKIPGTARKGVSGTFCNESRVSQTPPGAPRGPRLQVLFFENVGMSSGIEHQKSQLFVILLPDQEPVRFYMALPFPFAITA